MLTANEIRKKFLEYFVRQGHTEVPSSSLVPREDPSLLFTNAGMVQFKKVFLGQEKPGYNRATTSQKCLRVGGKHNDLENVGRTARHHTFFEMLGNFSFGDYFKEQAIGFAWEFLTKDLGLPKDKLYATVYLDDDEAHGLWRKVAGLPEERIHRLGEKDNFWSMGDTGPCGPCSEILVDQGEEMSCGPACGIGKCDCDRYLEVWNLVFMQYDQIEPGKRIPLPKPSIDTGMGLERISAICQGVHSNYDTDLFQRLIQHTAAVAKVNYHADPETDTALRVIADHSRAMAFMVADGILPSNEGRGYVLRRLIRRAFRFGRLMGLHDPFLHGTALEVVAAMGGHYPELTGNADFMARVVKEEEERFSQTLDKGLALLEEEMAKARASGQKAISGETVFKLYDTFGFPIDIVNDVAEKQGFTVDEAGYREHMAEQKKRAKAAWKGSGEVDLAGRFHALLEQGLRSEFSGYDEYETTSRIVALLDEQAESVALLPKGGKGYVVAARTPFYGESGGQTGDRGLLATPSGKAEVAQALKPAPALTVHPVSVTEGTILLDEEVRLQVLEGERLATARNHTATHLLHSALRRVLGEHVHQSGSLVGPDRLRFDFTHISAMTPEEISRVEELVNEAVLADISLHVETMPYEQATAKGAMALFGEKYQADVRVVQVPGVSIELCGGTHLRATGQTGPFVILSEAGVAAGIRRIEAATGFNALGLLNTQRRELAQAAGLLKARPEELADKLHSLTKELKTLRKENEKLAAQAALAGGPGGQGAQRDLMDQVREVGGVRLLTAEVGAPNVKALREVMDDVRSKLPSGVACLVTQSDGKVPLILYVSQDLHGRFTAQTLIKDVAAEVGGSGGGRPDLAQAGGTDPSGIAKAFKKLEELVGG